MLRTAPRLLAVLGPTNTGKTHLAIERMLGHKSGMIGFPLRLLARENYDRVARLRGARAVALITGEEKIVPPNPSYFICTVESMPVHRPVDFLGVDEIQLCADPERGHIFTARLLHARGFSETMFLGAETIKPLIRRLVPEAEFVSRPRLSCLSYTGHKKVTRLPPRSAVVAFNLGDVFSLAELVRRQRGGTAIVLGALSPRARNAQVGMFQSGEVDYLVATDAIGMGLNMDLDHVAFARIEKFDGKGPHRLGAAEIAQIAGRAGRHMSDGTFGTTGEEGPLDPTVVEAVESHRFAPLAHIKWRNAKLDFKSPAALLRSLEVRPSRPGLVQAREADDQRALQVLARRPEIARLARHEGRVRLLWEVCQIPDFRKTMNESHTRLLSECFLHLAGNEARLPTDWIARQMTNLERVEGDIDTLMARIAHIRTWTYISHHADWVSDALFWQERARSIEDRLSDALHDRLTERFVDRRAAFLVRRLATSDALSAAVSASGEVEVEGAYVGHLDGFRFCPDATEGVEVRPLLAAANRVLRGEVRRRLAALIGDRDDAFRIGEGGVVLWRGGAVGRLIAGERLLFARVEPLAGDFLEGELREELRRRLQSFVRRETERRLEPLFALLALELGGIARGLAFQIAEALGCLPVSSVAHEVAVLTKAERRALGRAGVRFGTQSLYVEPLLAFEALSFRALLWAVRNGAKVPPLPKPRQLSRPFAVDPSLPASFYEALSLSVLEGVAVRADCLERLAAAARQRARRGPFPADSELAAMIGTDASTLRRLLIGLGYRAHTIADGETLFVRERRRKRAAPRKIVTEDHPFAKLRALDIA